MSRAAYLQGKVFAGSSIPVAAEFDGVVGLFLEDEEEFNVSVTTFQSSIEILEQSNSSIMTSESPTKFGHSRSPTLDFAPTSPQEDHGSSTVSKSTTNCSQLTLTNNDEIEEFFVDQHRGLQLLHISQEYSWAPLGITTTAFNKIIQSAAVFDAIRNSVFFLGDRTLEVEVAPPRMQSQLLRCGLSRPNPNGCEVSYGLRFIERNNRAGYHPWSLRQFVVYNKTDLGADMSRWLFIAAPEVIREPIDHYLDKCGDEAAQNPFDVHCLLLNSVIGMWRPYLVYLTGKVDKHTKTLLLARPDGKGHFALINGRESQALKSLEDELLDTMLAMEATKDTASRLLGIYCMMNKTVHKVTSMQGQDVFDMTMHCLNEKQDDVELLIKQLTTLRSKLDSTTKAVANMVNLSMAQQTHQDTQAVKALTVIALVFLPTTVVLNFFSASFIDVRGNDMVLIGQWWLFIVISVPLTVIIMLAWKLWLQCQWPDLVAHINRTWQRLGHISRAFRTRRQRAPPDGHQEKDCMV